MVPGIRFIEEFPQFQNLFEKLYLKRELDTWYKEVCKQKLELPEKLNQINVIKNIKIQDNFSPSAHIYIDLEDKCGAEGFIFRQRINLLISKIIPVFKMDYLYLVKHNSLVGELGTFGSPQETFEALQAKEQIMNLFKTNNYIQLTEYDLHDTIYEWKELKLEPFDRRLTLDYAVFYDALELCEDS